MSTARAESKEQRESREQRAARASQRREHRRSAESKAQRREHHSAESIAAQRADSNETCFMYVAARAKSNESIAAQALRASESSSLGCGNPPREDAEFVCVCVCIAKNEKGLKSQYQKHPKWHEGESSSTISAVLLPVSVVFCFLCQFGSRHTSSNCGA